MFVLRRSRDFRPKPSVRDAVSLVFDVICVNHTYQQPTSPTLKLKTSTARAPWEENICRPPSIIEVFSADPLSVAVTATKEQACRCMVHSRSACQAHCLLCQSFTFSLAGSGPVILSSSLSMYAAISMKQASSSTVRILTRIDIAQATDYKCWRNSR